MCECLNFGAIKLAVPPDYFRSNPCAASAQSALHGQQNCHHFWGPDNCNSYFGDFSDVPDETSSTVQVSQYVFGICCLLLKWSNHWSGPSLESSPLPTINSTSSGFELSFRFVRTSWRKWCLTWEEYLDASRLLVLRAPFLVLGRLLNG